MAAAGAGGGVAPGSAYLLLGHGGLVESQLKMKTVPEGFTLVSRAACGKTTSVNGLDLLFNNSAHNEIYEPNSERGMRFLGTKLGPMTVDKEGSEFTDTRFFPFGIGHYKEHKLIWIVTSGVIQAPFTKEKWMNDKYNEDTPLAEVDILKYFNHSIYPTRAQVEMAIKKAIFFDDNKEVINETIPALEDRKKITLSQLAELWSLDAKILSGININNGTIGEFYSKHIQTLNMLLNINVSDLFAHLPSPGVVYALMCRSGPENNKNMGRRRIAEAELSRKRFAKKLQRPIEIEEEIQELEKSIEKAKGRYSHAIPYFLKQIEKLRKELAEFNGGGRRRTRRRRRSKAKA